jgi:aspartate racemase
MKTIGLVGGMSWGSSAEYYRLINEFVKERLGGFHSAKCLMYSFKFTEVEELLQKDNWERLIKLMVDAAKKLEREGADCIVICSNTMHKIAEEVEGSISIPLIHILDATAKEIRAVGLATAGLLGTKFTMEEDFYKRRLSEKFS